MICFTIGRCMVKIRFLFFAVLSFLLFSTMGEGAICGLLAAVLHELGHLAAMYACRVPPQEIRLNPFGIDIVERDDSARSYGKDTFISLAGPLANGLICLLCWFFEWKFAWEMQEWILANLAIGGMNLLPVEALDGGQALFATLCRKWSPSTSEKILEIVSLLILLPLGTLGFLLLLRSHYNFSLLLISLYLMLMLILKRGRYSAGKETHCNRRGKSV